MAIEQIQAKTNSGDRAGEIFTVDFDVPESLDDAVKKHSEENGGDVELGKDIVYSNYRQQLVISLQAYMRQQIQKDSATEETVQAAVNEWRLKKRAPAKSLAEKLEDLLGKLSPEERAELLSEMQA